MQTTVERLHVESEKALSVTKAHKRLRSFLSVQSAAAIRLVENEGEADDAAAEANAAALHRLLRVRVAGDVLFQLHSIADAIDEERQRHRTSSHTQHSNIHSNIDDQTTAHPLETAQGLSSQSGKRPRVKGEENTEGTAKTKARKLKKQKGGGEL